jgi:hypothetical protein
MHISNNHTSKKVKEKVLFSFKMMIKLNNSQNYCVRQSMKTVNLKKGKSNNKTRKKIIKKVMNY